MEYRSQTARRFVEAARGMEGTPFKHRGRLPGKGLDCAGLAVCAARACRLDVFDVKAYGAEPYKDGLRETLQRNCGAPLPNDPAQWRAGDVLLMRFTKEPHHIAILTDYALGGWGMIHASGETEKVIEHRLDEVWRDRIVEVYRLPLNPALECAEQTPTEQ